jgi:hypothetical protein
MSGTRIEAGTLAVVLSFLLAAGWGAGGAAQVAVAPGERVRIHQIEGPNLTGTLLDVGTSELRLSTEKKKVEVGVATANIERLERSLGTRKRFGRDFGLVVVTMALAGAAVGAATWKPCDDRSLLCWDRGETALMGAGIFGAIGVPVGLLAGVTSRHETWEDVPLVRPEGTALRILPVVGRERIGLVVSIPVRGF